MPGTADPQFRKDVLAGLSAPIPAIPARWLYDRRGSELFDEITQLQSYYPTRTETGLLGQVMPEITSCRQLTQMKQAARAYMNAPRE